MKDWKIFLTDYASYNEGTQFEFGHWVDLYGFTDASDLMEYIRDHFEECDKESPLDSPREEIMITDFEGFPESLYSESMGEEDFEKLFALAEWMEREGLENLDNEDENLLYIWNEYCSENGWDGEIYPYDDEHLNMLLPSNPADAFLAGLYASINHSDDYLIVNGYGNIESVSDPSDHIDETVLIDWILENKI